MQVQVNNETFDVPFDLSIIPLGKFIEYYEQYGRELDKQLKEISERKYDKLLQHEGIEVTDEDIELHQQMDVDSHLDNEGLAWFSFWTNSDLFEVKDMPSVQPLLSQYRVLRFMLHQSEEDALQLPADVEWRGDAWSIQDFKVNPSSEMNFNEIITSKEVMRQAYAIGKGKWDALPYLCTVFFRKKGERFTDELVIEGSERLQLMSELPMSYAIQVAFFLSISVSIWRNTLASSKEAELEIASLN